MVDIAFAAPEEREEIAQFMVTAFPRAKWDITGWRKLLAGRWAAEPYALRVKDKGRVVGCLGMVTANRPTAHGPAVTSNMSSWYLLKEYRGGGVGKEMLRLATSLPGVTVTNLASAKNAAPVVEAAGFAPLDTHRYVWVPQAGRRFEVSSDPASVPGILAIDAQVLADHEGLNLARWAVMTPDGPCVLCLSVKQKHGDYISHEVFYCGQRDLFARYAQTIANSIVPEGGVLASDSRFVLDGAEPTRIEELPVPRYYTAGHMRPEDIDHVYSEIILLDLKMH
ncbi:MAG: GNAT family protein [Pseudomonadota bacterium]